MSLFLLLLTFAVTHLLAVVSPGPSFVVILRTAAVHSKRAGIIAAFAMGVVTLGWALAAWFGLAALFAIFPWVYTGFKLAGAAYLIFLAIQLWRHAGDRFEIENVVGAETKGDWQAFKLGFLTQISNPKVAIFFGSIFVAILPPSPGEGLMAIVFAIVFLNEFVWYAFLATIMASKPVRQRYVAAKPKLDRLTGTFLGFLGARIAVD